MFSEMKNRVDHELENFMREINKRYRLSALSPVLYTHIKDFLLRDGKRVRPILFLIGYFGFSRNAAPGIYTSALAIELIHDFMLVHDDIIDKSEQRRGKPAMHVLLNTYLSRYPNLKFNGQDLTIVAGDVMYALAIDAFLRVKEKPLRKERALQELISAATLTGCGQFIEILNGIRPIDEITDKDIYNTYDLKTARYTFASPLTTGAKLAGAPEKEIKLLFNYGLHLGRAFQIKDDILGMFGDEKEIGKSTLSDLQEAKKTILIWYAYHHASPSDKDLLNEILKKSDVSREDLNTARAIVRKTGSLDFAKSQVSVLQKKAQKFLNASSIKSKQKDLLNIYSVEILKF